MGKTGKTTRMLMNAVKKIKETGYSVFVCVHTFEFRNYCKNKVPAKYFDKMIFVTPNRPDWDSKRMTIVGVDPSIVFIDHCVYEIILRNLQRTA